MGWFSGLLGATKTTISILISGCGRTSPSGTRKYTTGTKVRIRAYPSTGCVFDHWLIDGVEHKENPITIIA